MQRKKDCADLQLNWQESNGPSIAGAPGKNREKEKFMNANTLKLGFLMIAIFGLAGCQCQSGQEVVIPSSDTTPPSLVMDLHLPNGNIVSVMSTSTASTVLVPGGGRVTVIAKATDSEGAQDAQIWAASITTKIDPTTGLATQTGPGLLGAPSASNPDGHTAGQKACTERIVQQNLDVRTGPSGSVSFEVSARGVNFGGGNVRTATVTLKAQ